LCQVEGTKLGGKKSEGNSGTRHENKRLLTMKKITLYVSLVARSADLACGKTVEFLKDLLLERSRWSFSMLPSSEGVR